LAADLRLEPEGWNDEDSEMLTLSRTGMEAIMCHYRSYMSEEQAKAEAERKKELAAKRNEVVDTLLRDSKTRQKDAEEPAAAREAAPAK
jgi:hypothetical protein